ncbi:peptidoglycan-binding protein [filamentous cyanobacterium LEGE 11480]|uniref:Peptidoglycan-binding protein n=1 Tax=Romeriopsis navalis LEGE 11480 TaxID=2777977 RepID=A0A928VQB1_9CYAN|nr:peptidoglycan-binding domain-containing protein [Romeriopsis navalis]MBE9030640.1 peptidoglycan-binding protein [Romeriopsis navalis LEGE 11480]
MQLTHNIDTKHIDTNLDLALLREGDRGSNVAQLQARLAALDLYQGEITGYFDSATRQSLESFQRTYELDEYGCFGTETWYAMTFWSQETAFPSIKLWVKRSMQLLHDQLHTTYRLIYRG